MRLRRRAESVRWLWWANLFVTLVLAFINASEDLGVMVAGVSWAAAVMGVTHTIAWAIGKRAEKIIRL